MSRKAYIRGNLKKSDFLRVLLTDTSPYEVPIIVSNDGFYNNMIGLLDRSTSYQKIVDALIVKESGPYTIPFRYNIKKDEKSVRGLSIPHPRHQLSICRFYEKYTSLIPHYCSKGRFSIRRPARVGSTFFFSTNKSDANQFKNNTIDTQDLDMFVRNPASFYTYDGVSRLYKFFSSTNFIRLEKKYEYMMLLDISKCFDSIYTHTISWAVKNLKHSKENAGYSSFGNDFDRLMQSMNYNETNGICIGPEASRIFAEIILNKVDEICLQILSRSSRRLGSDFEIYRYVDDYIIFTRDVNDDKIVTSAIEEGLKHYNLYINHNKTVKYARPIVTEKSSVITSAKFHLENIFETVLDKTVEGYILPKKLYRPSSFSKNFIGTIKNQCFKDDVRYDAVSNYVISSLAKRIERLCGDFTEAKGKSREAEEFYTPLLYELIEVLFFFYTTNPTVASSFDVSRAIIVIDRFLKSHLSQHTLSFAERIHRNIRQLVRLNHMETANQRNMVPIEFLNVVLAASELVLEAHIEEDELVRVMFGNAKHDYHSFVSCMYYIKNRTAYRNIKNAILESIENRLGDCSDVLRSSHSAHIILDILSCPYVPKKVRKRILLRLRTALNLTQFSAADTEIVLTEFISNPWFVQWQGIDLLRMIRKKELSAVY